MKKNIKLIIFDLDGTIIQNPLFYKTVYSQSLNKLIEEKFGKDGIEILTFYRKNFQGRGELALSALNIPFSEWAEKLEKLPLDLIQKNKNLVKKIKSLSVRKVIYTGSPLKLTKRLLLKTGFNLKDFDEIIAWEKPEEFPLKWTCSPFVFYTLAQKYNQQKKNTFLIADNYQTDIFPASKSGISTINVKNKSLEDAINSLIKEDL